MINNSNSRLRSGCGQDAVRFGRRNRRSENDFDQRTEPSLTTLRNNTQSSETTSIRGVCHGGTGLVQRLPPALDPATSLFLLCDGKPGIAMESRESLDAVTGTGGGAMRDFPERGRPDYTKDLHVPRYSTYAALGFFRSYPGSISRQLTLGCLDQNTLTSTQMRSQSCAALNTSTAGNKGGLAAARDTSAATPSCYEIHFPNCLPSRTAWKLSVEHRRF